MQMGGGIRQSVADVDTDSLLSQNWPPSPPIRWRSCSETASATTEKHGRKKTEKTARNATEFLISVDLGKVWPPLVARGHGRVSPSTCLAASLHVIFLYYNGDILVYANCAQCVNCCV